MFFFFLFPSHSRSPPSLLLLPYQKCSLYMCTRLGKPVAGNGGRGVFVENISLFVHRALTKNGSIVVLLRVFLNKLWPKNTSRLTGYCYSRINLSFILFRYLFPFLVLPIFFPEYAEKCILYRKRNRDIRNASKDVMLNLSTIEKRKVKEWTFQRSTNWWYVCRKTSSNTTSKNQCTSSNLTTYWNV